MQIDRDVAVPTRDGSPVVADVFRPEGDDPVPVIASFGPYGKDVHWPDRYPLYDLLDHDIGDMLVPANHSEVAAAVVRPYVSERNHWIMKHHGVFQGVYWFHHVGADPNARDRYADHPWYQACVDFCADYDQNSFDPDYRSEPLPFFAPMVRRVFDPDRVHAPDLT
jgi:hypothetical protein